MAIRQPFFSNLKKSRSLGFITLLILIIIILLIINNSNKEEVICDVQITSTSKGKVVFRKKVEVAISNEDKAEGLRKKSLDKNPAMLFAWNNPRKPNFWMKNVAHDLGLIFFDANKKVTSIHKMRANESKHYTPKKPIKLALEVTSNKIEKINIGDNLHLVCSKN